MEPFVHDEFTELGVMSPSIATVLQLIAPQLEVYLDTLLRG